MYTIKGFMYKKSKEYSFIKKFTTLSELNDYLNNNNFTKFENISILYQGYDTLDIDFLKMLNTHTELNYVNLQIENIFDFKDINNIVKYIGNLDSIFINLKGEQYPTIMSDLKVANQIIEKELNIINNLNLSPLEKAMFAYDFAKNKEYLRSDDDNKIIDYCRSAAYCLITPYIVCLGYSKIFKWLLTKLDVNADIIILNETNGKTCHARNRAYIKDDKYKYEGILFFDVTSDRLYDNRLNNYNCFGLSHKEMDFISKIKFDYDPECEYITDKKLVEYMTKEIENISLLQTNVNNLMTLCNDKPIYINRQHREITANYFHKPLITDQDLINKVNNYQNMMERPLPYSTFKNILLKVKKLEYYINPEEYDYDELTINNILNHRAVEIINFNEELFRKKSSLQESIGSLCKRLNMGFKYGIPKDLQDVYNYYKCFANNKIPDSYIDNSIQKDISGTQLTLTLHQYSNKKKAK
jgi:hypothetical protein